MRLLVEDFEGPLDLLLHIIHEKKIDLLDLPIAEITEQYLSIMHSWQAFEMDIAADFLIMASRLIEMKARLMLPSEKEEKEDDPRQKLVFELIEYETVRELAQWISAEDEKQKHFLEHDPIYIEENTKPALTEIDMTGLYRMIRRLQENSRPEHTVDQKHLAPEHYTVEEKTECIEVYLAQNQSFLLRDLFDNRATACMEELCVSLLAVLEAFKNGRIDFKQESLHGEIYISRSAGTKL